MLLLTSGEINHSEFTRTLLSTGISFSKHEQVKNTGLQFRLKVIETETDVNKQSALGSSGDQLDKSWLRSPAVVQTFQF